MTEPFPSLIEIRKPDLLETYNFEPIEDRFGPLNRINIIVGPNNSGKSRLMRALFRSIEKQNVIAFNESSKLICELRHRFDSAMKAAQLAGLESEPLVRKLAKNASAMAIPFNLDTRVLESFSIKHSHFLASGEPAEELARNALSYALQFFAQAKDYRVSPVIPKLVYVPTLRGFRSPRAEHDYFTKRIRDDYFADFADKSLWVESGGEMYRTLTKYLLGDWSSRTKIRSFEEFFSQNFLGGLPFALIPREGGNEIVHIKVGSEREQPISEIGDGLQHIVIMLFAAFMDSSPTFLAIEEPEVFLHPGYQTRLLDCFLKPEFAHVQVLATTHSNHLINLTLDRGQTSIFQVTKAVDGTSNEEVPKFRVRPLSIEDRQILEDLGVERSSVLLSNCVLFVEGITDRRYYQRFLEIYASSVGGVNYIPDLHYSFLEYGGSNLVHWGFLESNQAMRFDRLVGHEVILVADRDTAKWKISRNEKLKRQFQERFVCADAIEVENLLGSAVIRSVVAEYEGTEIESVPTMAPSEYATERLGFYIESKIQSSKRKAQNEHPYAEVPKSGDGGGTLKDKTTFCDKALKYLNSKDDMTAAAWDATKQIYEFIARYNPRGARP